MLFLIFFSTFNNTIYVKYVMFPTLYFYPAEIQRQKFRKAFKQKNQLQSVFQS